MFFREKRIDGYACLHLVETVREDGRTRRRIVRNLGREEAVPASGAPDRPAASVGRFAERAIVLQAIERGDPALAVRRIGAPLSFGRLWEETGCAAGPKDQLAGRGFEFDVERAVFAAVLHRPMASGADRACARRMEDCAVPGADGLPEPVAGRDRSIRRIERRRRKAGGGAAPFPPRHGPARGGPARRRAGPRPPSRRAA